MAEDNSKITMEELTKAHTFAEDTNQFVAAKYGITRDTLFKRLRKELDAADMLEVPKRDKTGKVQEDEKGNTLMKKKKIPLWGTRQKARMDAHKLLEHYPSDKTDLNVGGTIPVQVYTGRPPPEKD